MAGESSDNRLEDILRVVSGNPEGCELKWSLFYSAIQSGNPNLIKPYPSSFFDKKSNEIQVELLQSTARQVPALDELVTGRVSDLPEPTIELLYWTFLTNKEPQLRPVAPQDYHPHLQKSLANKPRSQWPRYVFEVAGNCESNAEKRFQQHKEELGEGSLFAFHGSKLESFFSLLNFGLAQHLCKRDLYGEGAYLSTAIDVALNFSVKGTGWGKAHFLDDHFSCLALCEYVPNPLYIRNNPKSVPKSYVVLTNNEVVRIRYLLVFSKPPKRIRKKSNHRLWSSTGLLLIGVVVYFAVLALVGFFNKNKYFRNGPGGS